MSKKASGTTPREREYFLKQHGYTKVRSCNGSHDVWHHISLKDLCESAPKGQIEMPSNIRSCEQQSAWMVSMPDNPAHATWMRLQKQAQWAKETFEQATKKPETSVASLKACVLQQKRNLLKAWKKAVKNSLRNGQTPPAQPAQLKTVTR